ncbi:Double Clp-N motif-containing P-loop nucleoside triphosphate hydrolases superfamily protein [Striga hermonthica]|uniref:Double Clp-N motif-containing P-loop nucleoside triphosphate hydrolases superfamily protein n=1 Tax=Striga hermonthica TaxID=68872 RepID=A0A9N7RB29_STRHE|nr:Double Clp-N motif-containing P-loop nucleoside triphosphate hydrolases superfamily protein [Striga hermonthica]
MRAGSSSSCAAQQTLSAEAASVLKLSLTLARRRGHAQLTPLHVAATLLTSRAGLLRRACLLRSQAPHPLHCRALELCFNVALNRLPAAPGPLLSAPQPSLSNALVAALKRAQAHQRRGCIEQQQQQSHQQPPLVAVKVELEQLVLSILDDPSVSRVMREAGFSSTAVKSNLEDASASSVFQCYSTSGGIYSTPNSPPPETHHPINPFFHSPQSPFLISPPKKPGTVFSSLDEDIKVVMDVLLGRSRRKNTVIVGDSLSMAEHVVSEIMGRVERGDVPEQLKSAHFIKFQFSGVPLKLMKREEVEMNVSDLKRKVESFGSAGSRGVIIYTGDLKWTVETDCDDEKEENGDGVYRPVHHLVAEIGKLLSWYNNSNNGLSRMRVWLMATANYQTYMKCQMKHPPLDLHWGLQPVSVPTGGLGLSLNATSGHDSRMNFFDKHTTRDSDRKPFFVVPEEQEVLTCCPECKSNYEKEANFKSIHNNSFSSYSIDDHADNGSLHFPYWLKPHGIDSFVKDDLVQLRRKYNKLCQNLHKGSHNPINSTITNQSYLATDYSYPLSYSNWTNKNSSINSDSETISFTAYPSVKANNSHTPSTLPRFRRQQSCHIDFSFGNGSPKHQAVELNLDSLKGNDDDREVKITLALGNSTYGSNCSPKIKSANDNVDLVKLFQENLPWQSKNIPSVVEALLSRPKADSGHKFLFIKGNDVVGKRRLAVGIASFVFGSSELLFRTDMRKNAWDREMMEKALRDGEKLVFLVENVDYADCEFAKFLDEAYEKVDGHANAIFVLTMNESEAKITDSVVRMKLVVTDESNVPDHNNNKRKADCDLPMMVKSKSQKKTENEKQVYPNVLDLNIIAEDHQDERKATESDWLIRFMENIKKNIYVFNRDMDEEESAKETLLSKLKVCFEEVSGYRNNSSVFSVEGGVLGEILQGSGLYVNSLFEKWVKQVFETGLRKILGSGEGEGERTTKVRLCLDEGKEEICPQDDGFMGTSLPKTIPLSFTG